MTTPTKEEKEVYEDIIEECVVIRMKNIPSYMAGIDLTWLDEQIRKIKSKLLKELTR